MNRSEFIHAMESAMYHARDYEPKSDTIQYWIGLAFDALEQGDHANTPGHSDGIREELQEWIAQRRIESKGKGNVPKDYRGSFVKGKIYVLNELETFLESFDSSK